jgi:hypothetical protein
MVFVGVTPIFFCFAKQCVRNESPEKGSEPVRCFPGMEVAPFFVHSAVLECFYDCAFYESHVGGT